jgi:hypothetical protein
MVAVTSEPRGDRVRVFLVHMAEVGLRLSRSPAITSVLAVRPSVDTSHFHEGHRGFQRWLNNAREGDWRGFDPSITEDEERPLVRLGGLQFLDRKTIKDTPSRLATGDGIEVSGFGGHYDFESEVVLVGW